MTDWVELASVQRWIVQPGDVLLVRLPKQTNFQESERIRQYLARELPPEVRALVATADVEFSVVRAAV